ncbi:MAG: hypothetical protein D6732_01690, partial [Methanobacteriota archaeon]
KIPGVEITTLNYQLDLSGRELMVSGKNINLPEEGRTISLKFIPPNFYDAWLKVEKTSIALCCVQGSLKLVLFDDRKEMESFGELVELMLGEHQPMMITIPPRILWGWQTLPGNSATILMVTHEGNLPFLHIAPNSDLIPYHWKEKK